MISRRCFFLNYASGGCGTDFQFGGPLGPWFWVTGIQAEQLYRSSTTNYTIQIFGSDA